MEARCTENLLSDLWNESGKTVTFLIEYVTKLFEYTKSSSTPCLLLVNKNTKIHTFLLVYRDDIVLAAEITSQCEYITKSLQFFNAMNLPHFSPFSIYCNNDTQVEV